MNPSVSNANALVISLLHMFSNKTYPDSFSLKFKVSFSSLIGFFLAASEIASKVPALGTVERTG